MILEPAETREPLTEYVIPLRTLFRFVNVSRSFDATKGLKTCRGMIVDGDLAKKEHGQQRSEMQRSVSCYLCRWSHSD